MSNSKLRRKPLDKESIKKRIEEMQIAVKEEDEDPHTHQFPPYSDQ